VAAAAEAVAADSGAAKSAVAAALAAVAELEAMRSEVEQEAKRAIQVGSLETRTRAHMLDTGQKTVSPKLSQPTEKSEPIMNKTRVLEYVRSMQHLTKESNECEN
jgi:hypothetical protein